MQWKYKKPYAEGYVQERMNKEAVSEVSSEAASNQFNKLIFTEQVRG